MPAARFDLDRTLVRKETATSYVRYMRRRGGATWRDTARVTWWVAQYTLGVIDALDVARRAALGGPARRRARPVRGARRRPPRPRRRRRPPAAGRPGGAPPQCLS